MAAFRPRSFDSSAFTTSHVSPSIGRTGRSRCDARVQRRFGVNNRVQRRRLFIAGVLLIHFVSCRTQPGPDSKTATDDVSPQVLPSTTDTPATVTRSTNTASITALIADPAPIANTTRETALASAISTATAPPGDATSDESNPVVPALLDADGNPLPQTEERPSATSRSLVRRLELLVEAIAKDEPALALPAFFPVEAYTQVKAIAKPERDWQRRLVAAFERNIHEYHRKLGASATGVRFARLEVPEAKVKWMKPGSEGNRVGYFRVVRSQLVVATSEGRELPLELTSMISWRGEWYVVHLHGFE